MPIKANIPKPKISGKYKGRSVLCSLEYEGKFKFVIANFQCKAAGISSQGQKGEDEKRMKDKKRIKDKG